MAVIACQFSAAKSNDQARISAKIKDESGRGIDGATVSLLNAKDSLLVKVNLTEKDGAVTFDNIKNGSYLLKVSVVGYSTASLQAFIVGSGDKQVTVPDIVLTKKVSELNEVTVNEKKPFIERQLDRIVVNVNNSIVSVGSSALDVLARSPGVLVNQSDVISLKGKQGVTIMIDGKPTYLAAADLANLLRATPASSIDKIELITNPSAKFDASGSAGIINIKLKKDQRYGVNGTVQLSATQGIYTKLNEGINLNYRNKNINIFGSYNYTYKQGYNELILMRNFFNPDGSLNGAYSQDNYLKLPLHSHLVKAGMDYTLSKNTTIGVVFTGNIADFKPSGENVSDVLDSLRQKTSSFRTSSLSVNSPRNYAGNVNFKHVIDTTGQEITTDLDYARYANNNVQNYTTRYFRNDGSQLQPDDILRDNQNGALNIYSVKTDYVLPINKNEKFEAGFKSSYVKADNNLLFYNIINDVPQFDTTKSNHFIYKENINALYANYNRSFGQYKAQLGLRAEQTISNGDQLTTDNTFRNSYIQLFPSIFLSDKLDDKNEFTISAGRRIDRPTYRQLNPFKFFLDPSTYVEGNPYLKPQLTWQYDFSYTLYQKYTITLSYSSTTDNITSVLIPSADDARVTIQTDRNLATYYIYTASLSLPVDIAAWWSSNNNINAYYNKYAGDLANTQLNAAKFAFDVNSNNSFKISKTVTAELNAVYTSNNVYGYLFVNHVFDLSAGIQKTILRGKGTLKLNGTDLLRTNYLLGATNIGNYSEHFKRYNDSRTATLAFVYRFGSNKVAPAKRRAGGAEEEKKRAG